MILLIYFIIGIVVALILERLVGAFIVTQFKNDGYGMGVLYFAYFIVIFAWPIVLLLDLYVIFKSIKDHKNKQE